MSIKNNKEENIRHLPLYLLLTVVADCTLPTLASSEAVPDDAPAAIAAATTAEVKVATTERIDLTADRGHKVSIEFLASPKLTVTAWASLVSSDFRLVDTRGRADVMYELDGAFQALRPATQRTAEVHVGDCTENPAPLVTKSGWGGSVMLSPDLLAMSIGTITFNVRNATGMQDSVNVATAGDPDGKCLSRCKTWRYRQHNVVNLMHKEGSTEQKCSVLAAAEDAELVPARLVQSSFADLQEAAGLIVALGLSTSSALTKRMRRVCHWRIVLGSPIAEPLLRWARCSLGA